MTAIKLKGDTAQQGDSLVFFCLSYYVYIKACYKMQLLAAMEII